MTIRHAPRDRESPRGRRAIKRLTRLVAPDLLAAVLLTAALLAALRYAAALPPTRSAISAADSAAEPTFRNMYGVERNAGGPYRWTMPEAWFTVRVNAPGVYRIGLVLQESPLVATPRDVTLVAGRTASTYQLAPTPREYTIDYRAEPGAPGRVDWREVTIVLRADAFTAPGDARQLGVILTRVDVIPVSGPAPSRLDLLVTNVILLLLLYLSARLTGARVPLAGAIAGLAVALFAVLAVVARDVALFTAYQAVARPAIIAGVALFCAGAPLAARACGEESSPRRRLAWLLAGGAVLRIPLLFLPGYDVGESVVWSRVVNAVGIGGAYSATYPGRVNWYHYQPLYLYVLRLTGAISSTFGLDTPPSQWLVEALLKFWLVAAELALGYLIYRFVARRAVPGVALWAAAVYLLNPGLIWNTAYWGAVDAFHTFFLTAALFAAVERRAWRSWPLATLAVGTKLLALPGALATIPVALRRERPRQLAVALLAAVATALALSAPILARGELMAMARATVANLGDRPVISANAHNVWWLLTRGDGWRHDTEVLLGGVTYRDAGLALFATFTVWLLARLWRHPSGVVAICGGGALLTFGFATLTTEVHENWIYPLFAPLAVVAAIQPRYRPLYFALAASFLANLALHDRPLYHFLEDRGLGRPLEAARLLNAGARTALLVWWIWLWRRTVTGEPRARVGEGEAPREGAVQSTQG